MHTVGILGAGAMGAAAMHHFPVGEPQDESNTPLRRTTLVSEGKREPVFVTQAVVPEGSK